MSLQSGAEGHLKKTILPTMVLEQSYGLRMMGLSQHHFFFVKVFFLYAFFAYLYTE
jgi:hypothetical protein